jgi:hypothetical protein
VGVLGALGVTLGLAPRLTLPVAEGVTVVVGLGL